MRRSPLQILSLADFVVAAKPEFACLVFDNLTAPGTKAVPPWAYDRELIDCSCPAPGRTH